jgi:hypothetical protein
MLVTTPIGLGPQIIPKMARKPFILVHFRPLTFPSARWVRTGFTTGLSSPRLAGMLRSAWYIILFLGLSLQFSACKQPPPLSATLAKAEQGDVTAQLKVGQIYRSKGWETEAFKWFEKAAIQKSAEAAYQVGVLHLTSERLKNDTNAYKWMYVATQLKHKFGPDMLQQLQTALPAAAIDQARQEGDKILKGEPQP